MCSKNDFILPPDREKNQHSGENLPYVPLYPSPLTRQGTREYIPLLPCPFFAPCVPPSPHSNGVANERRSWSSLGCPTGHTTTTTPLVVLPLMQAGNQSKGLPYEIEMKISGGDIYRRDIEDEINEKNKSVVVVVVVVVVDGCTWLTKYATPPLDKAEKKV